MGYVAEWYRDHMGNVITNGTPVWYVLENKIQPGIVRQIYVVEPHVGGKRLRLTIENDNEKDRYFYGQTTKVHNSDLTIRRET
jgi:rRNA maturation protein Rpf1